MNPRDLVVAVLALHRWPIHARASDHVRCRTWAAVAAVLVSLACVQQPAAAQAKRLPLKGTALATPTIA